MDKHPLTMISDLEVVMLTIIFDECHRASIGESEGRVGIRRLVDVVDTISTVVVFRHDGFA